MNYSMFAYLLIGLLCALACSNNDVETQSVDMQLPTRNQITTCGDGICSPYEDSSDCPVDCSNCGDNLCTGEETETSCPIDCESESLPFDQPDQTISEDYGLAVDLGPQLTDQQVLEDSFCGDDTCDNEESIATCPIDCLDEGPQPDPNGEILGYVDQLQQQDGQWVIRGWACHQGWAPSVAVDIYADGDENSGIFIKRALAQEPQEEAVAQVCGVSEGQHRYRVTFTEEEVMTHAGQSIHVYGVSPVGNENRALNNSGNFSLPGGSVSNNDNEFPVGINEVTWLHTDVSTWPVTANLSVSINNGIICLDYDKNDVWPTTEIPHNSGDYNIDVVANPWVFLEYQGQWYAATWEWLVVNTSCKNLSSVAGDHIKQPAYIPLDWRPSSGQRLYFMVSGLARTASVTNIQERSQLVEVIWP